METFFIIIFVIVFLFFFLNRSNSMMRPWVRWVGWGMVALFVLLKIIK